MHLSQQRSSVGRTFHLFNPRPISWLQFGDWLRRLGYDLKPVEADDLQSIASGRGDPGSLAALKMLFGGERTGGSAARLDDCNTREGLGDTSITCPPVDDALLGVYLAHFTRSGLLQAPPAASGGTR